MRQAMNPKHATEINTPTAFLFQFFQ